MAENTSGRSTVAKILFIVGGLFLFVLLAIFIIRLVPVAISNIANLGNSIGSGITGIFKSEEITVSATPESATNGTPITVTFEYVSEAPGQYYVTYSCADGLFFDIQSTNGPKRIVCNTPLKLGENLKAISIIPIVTKANTFVDTTITIEYKDPQGNQIADGTAIVTVTNESSDTNATSTPAANPYNTNESNSGSNVTSTPVPAKPVTTTNTSTSYSRPTTVTTSYAPRTVDLAITQITKSGNDSAFVFHAYNLGNTPTGTWYFSYTDAENPSQTLISPAQGSLGAGQGMAVTVRYSGQKNSSQSVSVYADPYGYLSESNESNNSATVTITGDRTGGSGSGSYDDNDDADLVIESLQVGRLSGSRFVEEDEIDEDDTAAVRFVVANRGGESTGSWRFEIDNLPYNSSDVYRSKSYSSLRPGESIVIVADFDGIDQGDYDIRVEVDSADDVDEENERNNDESERLEVNR